MTETSRVIVGVSDEVGDVALLRRAAEEARRQHAVLVPVLAWYPVGGEQLYRAHPCPELARDWERRACDQLDELVVDAIGPEEPVRVQPTVVRAETLRQAVESVAVRPGDVTFLPTPRTGLLARLGLRHHHNHGHGVALAS